MVCQQIGEKGARQHLLQESKKELKMLPGVCIYVHMHAGKKMLQLFCSYVAF